MSYEKTDYVLVPRSTVVAAKERPSEDSKEAKVTTKEVSLLNSPKLRMALGSQGSAPFVTTLTHYAALTLSGSAIPFIHDDFIPSAVGEWSNLSVVFEEYRVFNLTTTYDFGSLFVPPTPSTTSSQQSNCRGATWCASITHEPFDGVTPTFASEVDRSESKILQVNPARTVHVLRFHPQYCYNATAGITARGWQTTNSASAHAWGNNRLCANKIPVYNADGSALVRVVRAVVEFRHRK